MGTMRRLLVVLAVLSMALTACAEEEPDDTMSSAVRQTPATAPAPPPAPEVGACYDLAYRDASRASSQAAPVPCRQPHTAVTVFVGTVNTIADGHLVAMDSERVAAQVSSVCPRKLADHLGGDAEARRLSRFQSVWFAPTVEQAARGAVWYRCDLVALAGNRRLMRLPRETRGMLDREDVLDRFGTCGTAAPGRKGFARVSCGRPHAWRAVTTIDLPQDAKYLGRTAAEEADARCRDVAADASGFALRFSWSFEWPAREAWQDGQRWGWCWLPD